MRERFEHRLQLVAGQFLRILAEDDALGSLRTSSAKQIHPSAIAIIDLGAKLLRKLDLRRLAVDEGHRDLLGHQHLRHGLPEAAVPDDDGIGVRRRFRSVQIDVRLRNPAEDPFDDLHQKGRRDHRDGDNRAEEGCGSLLDQHGSRRLAEKHEAKLARLAQQ